MTEPLANNKIEGPHVTLLNNDVRHLHALAVRELQETQELFEAGQIEEYQLEYRKFLVKKLDEMISLSNDGEMLVVAPLSLDE